MFHTAFKTKTFEVLYVGTIPHSTTWRHTLHCSSINKTNTVSVYIEKKGNIFCIIYIWLAHEFGQHCLQSWVSSYCFHNKSPINSLWATYCRGSCHWKTWEWKSSLLFQHLWFTFKMSWFACEFDGQITHSNMWIWIHTNRWRYTQTHTHTSWTVSGGCW